MYIPASPIIILNIYRLQTKLREGNIFTGVCDSVQGGGGLVPGGAWWRPPPRTATAAGGTHPTGMHSCLVLKSICSAIQTYLYIIHLKLVAT